MLTPGTTAGAGYLADGGGPPVLVLHAWWGLVRTVTDVCDRLSNAGFTAFGPDLYDGRTATTVAAATQLSGALDPEAATARVASAAHELRSQAPGPLSVVGFSLGASFALDLALGEQPPEKIVCYYGTGEVPARGEAFVRHPRSFRRDRRLRAVGVGDRGRDRPSPGRGRRGVPPLSRSSALVRRTGPAGVRPGGRRGGLGTHRVPARRGLSRRWCAPRWCPGRTPDRALWHDPC